MTTSTTDTAALNERVWQALGWTRFDYEMGSDDCWIPPGQRQHACNLVFATMMPSYADSLDWMAKAESTLTEEQFQAFACALQRITMKRGLFGWARATAEDRCLAFLEGKQYRPLNAQRAGVSEGV